MSKKRWLISVLLIFVVASVLLFLLLYHRSYRSEQPLNVSLSEYPEYVTSASVILRGYVSDEAIIELSRDTLSLGTVFSRDNKFEAEVELQPGQNQIRFSARRPFEIVPFPSEISAIITWEPKNPPVPTIHSLPAITNVSAVTIKGAAYPHGRIEVLISGDAEGTQQIHYLTAGKDGIFQLPAWLPAPGTYKVSCWAHNSKGTKSIAPSEMQVVYDPDWYPAARPVESSNPRRIVRKADIVLTHKRMTITLEATLPRDDPAVTTLLANQSGLDAFFGSIFGLSINESYYIEFGNVAPQIVIKDQDATIKATTLPYRAGRDYLPVLHGDLKLGGSNGFPFSNPDDRVSITTYDYTIESVGPSPTRIENNTLTWMGGDRPSGFSGNYDVMIIGRSVHKSSCNWPIIRSPLHEIFCVWRK